MAAASQLHPKEQTFGDDGEGSCWCRDRTGAPQQNSPWTNSKPLIAFCLSALTVPFVLPAMCLDIGISLY
jgi:hypothetical protein